MIFLRVNYKYKAQDKMYILKICYTWDLPLNGLLCVSWIDIQLRMGGGYQNSAYLYTFLQWLVAKWINMEYLIENEIVCLFVLFYVLKWMENDEVKWVR